MRQLRNNTHEHKVAEEFAPTRGFVLMVNLLTFLNSFRSQRGIDQLLISLGLLCSSSDVPALAVMNALEEDRGVVQLDHEVI